MVKPKKAKFTKEVEEIRRLRDISRILKAGDVENALLSNAAKETETMNDNVLDKLLANADIEQHGGGKGLEIIERLTTSAAGGGRVMREKKVQVKKRHGKVTVTKLLHSVKKGAKPKAAKRKR